ncbi:hypothetical protein HYH03_018533 [Edaphochlamys debaryana]|uniref:Uncharacterized protein n=1 Tax=Edaphochlamys debaryana TaxID=47281 RepID=A0A835XGC4_9CHLO|nr:hypothetical protein HYH03_018533 [Edaphochlamys debaryana]|eukprot:KAG2482542.1 hypothetical protein HYH03_018533 [Edaphochlamys debaryana]
MPTSRGRKSLEAPIGSIEEALLSLKLRGSDEQARRLDSVLKVLRDVLSGPNIYQACGDQDDEALWWEVFADVYANEVHAQTSAAGGKEPSCSCKRQILADILVWAEVTQDHYDSGTARFVTEPHAGDESFQRIGATFRKVKATRLGLGLRSNPEAGCGSPSLGGARCGARQSDSTSSQSDCSSETRT